MAAPNNPENPEPDELVAMVRSIRDRVREAHPVSPAGDARIPLADLMHLLHARDAAEGKVAAIGSVNPRAPGLLNHLVQFCKRFLARVLDWHVREQIEFNRALVECVNATIEAVNESNRGISQLAAEQTRLAAEQVRLAAEPVRLRQEIADVVEGPLLAELRELKDIRTHWDQWRHGWEEKLSATEIEFLRGVADLRSAFDQRVTQMDSSFRASSRASHAEFTAALERTSREVQQAVRDDFELIRREYERLIHNELRIVRQRATLLPSVAAPSIDPPLQALPAPRIDHLRFAARFRGSEDHVKRGLEFYLNRFSGCEQVLDLGCGRGEFLDVMRSAGIPARGVDLDEESVKLCKAKRLDAKVADIFEHLEAAEDGALDGIFCSQVIEHLTPAQLPRLIGLAAASLCRGGLIALETPNPECLAIFASHFYIDPTHIRPVPASLLSFYLEEAGFGRIEIHQLSPAVDSMPSLATLPAEFRETFFGGLDYAILARRL